MYLANFKRINEANLTFDIVSKTYKMLDGAREERTVILTERHAFYPNEFGIYNIIGNAAEMVAERGIAKGGSYNDPGFDIRIENEKKYEYA